MTQLRADGKHFQLLNEEIHACMDTDIELTGCMGQRYIASGLSGKHLRIHGTPGNALGAYADGCTVEVFGNAQDATGDTMNAGEIVIHGSCGDATGYAMRGGSILVEGNVGYRAGIHMKAYKDQIPVLVIGGEAGSFLGEYQAGGYIIVLGLHSAAQAPVGRLLFRRNARRKAIHPHRRAAPRRSSRASHGPRRDPRRPCRNPPLSRTLLRRLRHPPLRSLFLPLLRHHPQHRDPLQAVICNKLSEKILRERGLF